MLTRCVLGNIQSHTRTSHVNKTSVTPESYQRKSRCQTHTQTSRWWSVPCPLISYSISRIKEGCRPCRLHPVCVMGNDIMRLLWPHRLRQRGRKQSEGGMEEGFTNRFKLNFYSLSSIVCSYEWHNKKHQ